eukprot:CAMPEP_0198124368 /NCGR_PEP_ID=MMETSP1442-20131203/39757_1 /TAXON_ID= /ORGANISM="Craspedostauros australis, Strain CCMP3328" /LENGTH=95 /DNA_ID=CAMNT_0043783751 /DNA_START=52 /DNA_END=339 /DNA_ORIENTATION=+
MTEPRIWMERFEKRASSLAPRSTKPRYWRTVPSVPSTWNVQVSKCVGPGSNRHLNPCIGGSTFTCPWGSKMTVLTPITSPPTSSSTIHDPSRSVG